MGDAYQFDPLKLGPGVFGSGAYVPLYPPEGMLFPPVPDGTEGLVRLEFYDPPRWAVIIGSKAWMDWADNISADGSSTFNWGQGVVPTPILIDATTTVDVDPGTVRFRAPPTPPPIVIAPEVVNDPTAGPVIAGQPTDNGPLNVFWRLPGTIVGKFLPPGPVHPVLGVVLLALPFGLVALAVLWFLRRAKK